MKKILSLLLLLVISNIGLGTAYYWVNPAGGDFWTPSNWNTSSDGTGTNPTFPVAQTDYLRLHSAVVGNTPITVDCPINDAYMTGAIWRNASGGSLYEGNYSLNIYGSGSLVLARCMGLAYSDYPAYADVNFASGTIYVVGDTGTVAEPNNTNSYFKIAHRGQASLTIRNGAIFKMLGNGGLFVAGSANSTLLNRGRLTVAGQLDMGPSPLYAARRDDSSLLAVAGDIEGRLILESTGSIVGNPNIWLACNPNIKGVFDINTGATLDLINSPTIAKIYIADYGIGTLNIKPGARFTASSARLAITTTGSNKQPTAAINVEDNGFFNFPNQSLTFANSDTADVNHAATAYLNVAADACCAGRSVLGAVGLNDKFYLNLDGQMTLANYLYLTTLGQGTANLNAGSVFTGVKITGARSSGSQATINSSGDVTLTTGDYTAAIDGIGTINVLDGSVYMPSTKLYACSGIGQGTINVSGGEVTAAEFYTASGGGQGTFNLSGGLFTVSKSMASSHNDSIGVFNFTGGEFYSEGYYTTIAQKGDGTMTMTGGTVTVNRLVLANYPNATGTATITGGRLNVNGHIGIAQQADGTGTSVGTLTIGGTADVNVSDWDPYNTSRGIMVGQIKALDDPFYAPSYKNLGDSTFILDGSTATVKTSYFTLGGRVVDGEGLATDAGPSRAEFKLDGVHGVGSGIYATYDVFLSDGPAANTGIVPSFKGTPAVGIYNVIKAEGTIDVNDSYTGNLMLNSPGWSYKVVDAGEQQRLKLLYCDKGDNSCRVDLRCFAALAAQWLDGNADGYDLAYLANNWLKTFSSL